VQVIVTLRRYHVFFVGPAGEPLGNIMADLRTWLDGHKIAPLSFSYETTRSDKFALHLTFAERHQAELFERTFCNPDALPDEPVRRRA
jgi:hypothetical protein